MLLLTRSNARSIWASASTIDPVRRQSVAITSTELHPSTTCWLVTRIPGATALMNITAKEPLFAEICRGLRSGGRRAVLYPHHVKTIVGKLHVKCVREAKHYAVAQPGAGGEHLYTRQNFSVRSNTVSAHPNSPASVRAGDHRCLRLPVRRASSRSPLCQRESDLPEQGYPP